jgi:hypothetical protein
MSLDLLKLDKQNDPRDGSQLKLPVLTNQAQMSPPPEQGVFTRGQGPTPSTPPIPFSTEQQQPAQPQQQQQPEQQATNPLEQVLNPDVSSLVNPYAGDLGKLSLGDIQRLGFPETIPSSIEEPELTGKIGPDSSFEDIQQGVQTSYEKKRAGMDDSVNQVLANPTPVYAFPDPTAPIQINQRPTTEEYLYGSQGKPGLPQTSFGAEFNNNPFTQGNQGFSQNSTAGVISQSGGLVSRLGNALHFDDKFGEYAKKDINNIGNFLDPRAWFKYGTAYGNALQGKASWESVEKETPLFKLFENVGGDNGSYGPGLIGSTFRALDLIDNTARGTVADIFQQKRLGEKTGNNLYRATVGGQDYSSFQVRSKGSSPFALIPEKFDVNNPSHWGLGLGAFVIDAATGVVTGAGLGKILKNTGKVKTLLRGGQLAPTPAVAPSINKAINKAQILKTSGQTPVGVPVPKTPAKIYEEAIAAKTTKTTQTVTLLQTPNGSLAKAIPLAPVKKTSSKPKLVVEPKTVTIQTPSSISPEKAPFNIQVATETTPTLVPPRRVLDPFAMKNTAIILDEIARRKAGGPITKAINEVPFSPAQGTQRIRDEVARQQGIIDSGTQAILAEKARQGSPGVISDALDSIPTPQVYKDGTEAIIREKIRQADNPIPGPSVVGDYLKRQKPEAPNNRLIGQVEPPRTKEGMGAGTAALFDLEAGLPVNPAFVREPFKGVSALDPEYRKWYLDAQRYKNELPDTHIDAAQWSDGKDFSNRVDAAPKPGTDVYRPAQGDYLPTVRNFEAGDHLEILGALPQTKGDIYQRLNLAKLFLEQGDVMLGMDYLKSASTYFQDVAEQFPELSRGVSKYFDEKGMFKADFTPEVARKIVKGYSLDAPPDVVDYVKELYSQGYNKQALFKAAQEDGTIIIDTAGNIRETDELVKSTGLPVSPPSAAALTSDELNAISPVIKPEELVPQPKVSEALIASKNDPEAFISAVAPVSRTNADLTKLAIFMGHVKPRKAPLSAKQLDVLRQQYGDLYSKMGGKIDTNKFDSPAPRIEVQPGNKVSGEARVTKLIDKRADALPGEVKPGSLEDIQKLLTKRQQLLSSLGTDNIEEVLKVNDEILNMGPIDYADPKNMEVIQKSLPSELRTSTPEGHILTVRMVQNEDVLGETMGELQTVQKELSDLENLLKSDSTDILSTSHAAPDTHEVGAAFSKSVWDLNDVTPGHLPLNLNPKKGVDDLEELISPELAKVDWYHGSRVDPELYDLRQIDPDLNTTLHEMGPGVYLTTDPDSAKYWAEAHPSGNLPADIITSETGTIAQVIPEIDGFTIIANKPPNSAVRDAFRDAAMKAGAPMKVVTSLIGSVGQSKTVEGLWDIFYDTYSRIVGSPDTGLFHRFQVNVANNLRNNGYGAIVKLPEKQGDEAVLNILGRGGDPMPLSIGNVARTDTPDLLDSLAARVNAEKSKGLSSDASKYLETQARIQLNVQAQDVLKQKEEALLDKVESVLTENHKIEKMLEDIATEEKKVTKQITAIEAEDAKKSVVTEAKNPEGLNPCL